MFKKFFVIVSMLTITLSAFSVNTFATSREENWLSLSKNTDGPRYIVNSKGQPFNMFGMARSQYCEPVDETPMYGDIRALSKHFKDLGCNAIRLAIGVNNMHYPRNDFIEECGGYNGAGINKFIDEYVDPDVQGIIAEGMYVVLDLHEYPPSDDRRDPNPQLILDYARDHYIPIWRELAKRYKNEPMIAMYELWNEPYPADQGSLKLTEKGLIAQGKYEGFDWNAGVRKFFIDCVNEVRKYDTKHMILVSDWNAGWGSAWPTAWGDHKDLLDPKYNNVLFSAHAAKDHLLDHVYASYWANLAKNNNIFIQLGEVETEEWMATEQSMKDFVEFLEEYKDSHHFSAFLWRPHNTPNNKFDYVEIWPEFAKSYTTKPLSDTTVLPVSSVSDTSSVKNSVTAISNDVSKEESSKNGYSSETISSYDTSIQDTNNSYETSSEYISSDIGSEKKGFNPLLVILPIIGMLVVATVVMTILYFAKKK